MKKTFFKQVKILLLFFTLALGAQLKAQTTASENAEEQAASLVTDGDWKTFEGKVSSYLTSKGIAHATQVYIDVYLDNSATPSKRIVADVVFKNGTKYQVGDAKASASKKLTTDNDLTSVCTKNQQVIYPAINLVAGKGIVTKAVVKGGVGLGNIGLTLDGPIALYTAAKTGVQFYVTSTPGAYSGAPFPRIMVLTP
jgi:hypothetical protein